MIGPVEIYQASRRWRCGWLVAWTRLRYQREFWQEHPDPEPNPRSGKAADANASRQRG